MEDLSELFNLDVKKLSKNEKRILEMNLLIHVLDELTKHFFFSENKPFFHLTNIGKTSEDCMIELNVIQCLINDILDSKQYSLLGIANYTQLPEEVLYDLILGKNTNPSVYVARKILEIHKSVRPEIYNKIAEKIRAL